MVLFPHHGKPQIKLQLQEWEMNYQFNSILPVSSRHHGKPPQMAAHCMVWCLSPRQISLQTWQVGQTSVVNFSVIQENKQINAITLSKWKDMYQLKI